MSQTHLPTLKADMIANFTILNTIPMIEESNDAADMITIGTEGQD